MEGMSDDEDDFLNSSQVLKACENAEKPMEEFGCDQATIDTWIYPKSDEYKVRDYQLKMVEASLFHNTLVCLPTGMGKTLIGSVVIYNYMRWFPDKMVIFMAPTRHLIEQQLRGCLDVVGIPSDKVAKMDGHVSVDERARLWKSKKLFFCTPQVVQNDCKCYIKREDVVLLVFDEAHRATGNHAYCKVVEEVAAAQKQFRVLALSATPGKDSERVQHVVDKLLISKIEYKNEDHPDVAPYVHQKSMEMTIVTPSENIRSLSADLDKLVLPVVTKLRKMPECPKELFAKTLSHALVSVLNGRMFNGDQRAIMQLRSGIALLTVLLQAKQQLMVGGVECFLKCLDNAQKKEFLSRDKKEMFKSPGFLALIKKGEQHRDENPKMARLVQVLQEHFARYAAAGTRTSAIVFAQHRSTVAEIQKSLSAQTELRASPFVGQSSKKGKSTKGKKKQSDGNDQDMNNGDSDDESKKSLAQILEGGNGKEEEEETVATRGQNQVQQRAIVKQFRDGDLDVLIATCIGEEGLDVGSVDLIVCFDALKSPVRMIQRFGRAGRKRSGKVMVLVTEGKEKNDFQSGLANSKKVHSFLSNKLYRQNLTYYPNPQLFPPGASPKLQYMKLDIAEFHQSQIGGFKSRTKKSSSSSSTLGVTKGRKRKPKVVEYNGMTPLDEDQVLLHKRQFDKVWTRSQELADQVLVRQSVSVRNISSSTRSALLGSICEYDPTKHGSKHLPELLRSKPKNRSIVEDDDSGDSDLENVQIYTSSSRKSCTERKQQPNDQTEEENHNHRNNDESKDEDEDNDELLFQDEPLVSKEEETKDRESPPKVPPPSPRFKVGDFVYLRKNAMKGLASIVKVHAEKKPTYDIRFDTDGEMQKNMLETQLLERKVIPRPKSKFVVGNTVTVRPRTGPGMNKEGGTAKVIAVHSDKTYDVRYFLNSKVEKGVAEHLMGLGIEINGEALEGKRKRKQRNMGAFMIPHDFDEDDYEDTLLGNQLFHDDDEEEFVKKNPQSKQNSNKDEKEEAEFDQNDVEVLNKTEENDVLQESDDESLFAEEIPPPPSQRETKTLVKVKRVQCSICGEFDVESDMFRCSEKACSVTVHKKCSWTGIKDGTEGCWKCDACCEAIEFTNRHCFLCSRKDGAMTCMGFFWVHLCCVEWNPYTTIDRDEHGSVKGTNFSELARSGRLKLNMDQCCICKKTAGVCVQCKKESCKSKFHPSCAITENISLSKRFCPEHVDPCEPILAPAKEPIVVVPSDIPNSKKNDDGHLEARLINSPPNKETPPSKSALYSSGKNKQKTINDPCDSRPFSQKAIRIDKKKLTWGLDKEEEEEIDSKAITEVQTKQRAEDIVDVDVEDEDEEECEFMVDTNEVGKPIHIAQREEPKTPKSIISNCRTKKKRRVIHDSDSNASTPVHKLPNPIVTLESKATELSLRGNQDTVVSTPTNKPMVSLNNNYKKKKKKVIDDSDVDNTPITTPGQRKRIEVPSQGDEESPDSRHDPSSGEKVNKRKKRRLVKKKLQNVKQMFMEDEADRSGDEDLHDDMNENDEDDESKSDISGLIASQETTGSTDDGVHVYRRVNFDSPMGPLPGHNRAPYRLSSRYHMPVLQDAMNQLNRYKHVDIHEEDEKMTDTPEQKSRKSTKVNAPTFAIIEDEDEDDEEEDLDEKEEELLPEKQSKKEIERFHSSSSSSKHSQQERGVSSQREKLPLVEIDPNKVPMQQQPPPHQMQSQQTTFRGGDQHKKMMIKPLHFEVKANNASRGSRLLIWGNSKNPRRLASDVGLKLRSMTEEVEFQYEKVFDLEGADFVVSSRVGVVVMTQFRLVKLFMNGILDESIAKLFQSYSLPFIVIQHDQTEGPDLQLGDPGMGHGKDFFKAFMLLQDTSNVEVVLTGNEQDTANAIFAVAKRERSKHCSLSCLDLSEIETDRLEDHPRQVLKFLSSIIGMNMVCAKRLLYMLSNKSLGSVLGSGLKPKFIVDSVPGITFPIAGKIASYLNRQVSKY